jgi:hypothetical protein
VAVVRRLRENHRSRTRGDRQRVGVRDRRVLKRAGCQDCGRRSTPSSWCFAFSSPSRPGKSDRPPFAPETPGALLVRPYTVRPGPSCQLPGEERHHHHEGRACEADVILRRRIGRGRRRSSRRRHRDK